MDRWNIAIGRIEEHLDRDIDVRELARVALSSEHHFRRMFSALAGMPISEYIRRRRLTVAAADVLEGREAIQDIAVKYGYTSADAFSRAFRAVHGLGPREARESGAVLRAQPRLVITLNIEGEQQMRYRLETREPFALVGRRKRIRLVYEGLNQEMIEFHRQVGEDVTNAIGDLSTVEPGGTLAVSVDFQEGREDGSFFDCWIAAAVESGPGELMLGEQRLDVLEVPARTWLVLSSADAEVESIQQLWVDAYGAWFPANPYSAVPGPEICVTVHDEDGNALHAELWLPVEKE